MLTAWWCAPSLGEDNVSPNKRKVPERILLLWSLHPLSPGKWLWIHWKELAKDPLPWKGLFRSKDISTQQLMASPAARPTPFSPGVPLSWQCHKQTLLLPALILLLSHFRLAAAMQAGPWATCWTWPTWSLQRSLLCPLFPMAATWGWWCCALSCWCPWYCLHGFSSTSPSACRRGLFRKKLGVEGPYHLSYSGLGDPGRAGCTAEPLSPHTEATDCTTRAFISSDSHLHWQTLGHQARHSLSRTEQAGVTSLNGS